MTAEERLTRIERQTRRWNLILSIAVIGLCGYVGFREFTVARIVRAREIEIVGDHGRPVIKLTRDPEGDGQIDTFSAKAERMVSLSTSPTGGMFNLYNSLGHPIVSVQCNKANAGAVFVKNSEGQTQDSITGSPAIPRTQISGNPTLWR